MSVATPPLLETIDKLVDAGRSLDQIEADVLSPSSLTEEQRAALWLHAWSRRVDCDHRRRRRLPGVPDIPPC